MSLSHAQLDAITQEIDELAVPSSLQRVFARDAKAIVLQLRGGGQTRYLLLDPTSGSTRLHFVDAKPQQPPSPPGFVMLLRKRLVGAVLQSVQLAVDDRVVSLHFEKRIEDERRPLVLVARLFGRTGKIELLDEFASTESSGAASPNQTEDPLHLATLPVGERSATVARWYAQQLGEAAEDRGRADLRGALKREVKRARRLVKNLQADLDRVDAAAGYRRFGELLQSAYALDVPRGAEFVAVPDYYADGAPQVEIPLDPTRGLKDNIARYFHEYRRMTAAGDQITERLFDAEEKLEALEAARARLDTVPEDELEAFGDELRHGGLLRRRRKQQVKGRAVARKPYREFTARSGARVLVGRGSRDNDELTTRIARGRDVWLHARDWAGSHVLLRMDADGEPRGEDLRDAALLAAHFSKGKNDTTVEVTHTRAKWVRKPKGAPAGLVTVAGGSTVIVRTDDPRLWELLEGEVFHD